MSHYFMANTWGKSGNSDRFYFLDSNIMVDDDCSVKLKDAAPWRKVVTNLYRVFKSREIILPTKVHLVKAMLFPLVMYGLESWTIKKAEHQRTDTFKLWCWKRPLRVPGTARRSNHQS